MFCGNCGTPLDENGVCPNCGAKLVEVAQDSPETIQGNEQSETQNQSQIPDTVPPDQNETNFQPQIPPVMADDGNNTYIPATVPAPKKKTGLVVLLVAILVVALAVVGYAAYPRILRSVMGEGRYYIKQELSGMDDGIDDTMDLISEQTKENRRVEGDMSLSLSGDNADMEEISEALDQTVIHYLTQTDKKGNAQFDFSLKKDNDDIGSFSLLEMDGKNAISFMGDKKQYLLGTNSLMKELQDEDFLENMTGKDEEELYKWLYSYADTAMNSIPKDCISTGKDEYQGKKYTTVTFTLDEKSLPAMLNAIADQMEKDDDLPKIAQNICDYLEDNDELMPSFGFSEVPDETEIADGIDELIDSIRDAADEAENTEEVVEYVVYYTSRGKIIARAVSADDGVLTFGTWCKDNKNYIALTFEADQEEVFSFTMWYQEDDKKCSGEGSLQIDGAEVLSLDYDLKMTKVGGVEMLTGEANLDVDYDSVSASLKYTSDADDDTLNSVCKVNVNYAGEDITVKITNQAKCSNKPDFDGLEVKDNAKKIEDASDKLQDYATDFSSNLQEAYSELFSLGGNNYDYGDYDYDYDNDYYGDYGDYNDDGSNDAFSSYFSNTAYRSRS